jgi:hypothetical protein
MPVIGEKKPYGKNAWPKGYIKGLLGESWIIIYDYLYNLTSALLFAYFFFNLFIFVYK